MTVDEFINKLSAYDGSETVTNIYTNSARRQRLKTYLEQNKDARILLVGEAPGHKGCARTGVPFTSDDNEQSAKIIQKIIAKEFPNEKPLIWNAFPFHPHEANKPASNRKPNTKELADGFTILKDLLSVFPQIICFGAIGRVAEESLAKLNLANKPSYIRHPSHGGKKDCEEDFHYAAMRFNLIITWDGILRETASAQGDKAAAYRYLKEHEDDFREWYYTGHHDEYPYAYWNNIKEI